MSNSLPSSSGKLASTCIMSSDHAPKATSLEYVGDCQTAQVARWRTQEGLETTNQAQIHLSPQDDAGGALLPVSQGRAETMTRVSSSYREYRDGAESPEGNVAEEAIRNFSRKHGKQGRCVRSFPMFNVYPRGGRKMALCNDPVNDNHKELPNCKVDLDDMALHRSELGKVCPMLGQANPRTEVLSRQCSQLNHPEIALSPARITPPHSRKQESFLLPRWPCALKNMEAMRICATVGSVREISGEPCDISTTTHRFLLTKETALNMPEGGPRFRESRFSMKLKGKLFVDFFTLSRDLGFGCQQGMKLQHANREGWERIRDVKRSELCIKNESSAEKNMLDADNFRGSRPSDVSSSSSDKTVRGVQNSSASEATAPLLLEDVGNRLPNSITSDGKEVLPAAPDRESSLDTSKTQSMNVERLLPCPKRQKKAMSSDYCRARSELEPATRWVKHLKTSASEPIGHGTKSLEIGEPSRCGKVNSDLNKMLQCSSTNTERHEEGISGGKKSMALGSLAQRGEPSLSWKHPEITLSHPWIRRWCQSKASCTRKGKDSAPVVNNEPEIPKIAAVDAIQRKQFPSIAAMALMGKALSGFTPSNLRKKGSLIVWNTRDLR